jgi:tight adherence protein C
MNLLWRLCRGGFLVVAAVALLAAPAYADDNTQLTVSQVRETAFPSVTARFTITSVRGSPLPLLNPSDFVVTEDGQSVGTIHSYSLFSSAQRPPLALVIALDASASMAEGGKLVGAKNAAKAFISQLRQVDRVEIISFGDQVGVVVPFTNDRAALSRGIDSLAPKGAPVFFDATDRAVTDVLKEPGTRMVSIITDGQDMASQDKLAPALDHARKAQVPIYTIGLGPNVDESMLTRMASETAGRYFKAPTANDLMSVFQLLAVDIANQYEVTYFSPQSLVVGKQVSVVIQVKRPDFPPTQGQFTYIMPPALPSTPAPVDPGTLRAVVVATPTVLPALQPPEAAAVTPSRFSPEMAAVLAFGAFLAVVVGFVLSFTSDPRDTRLAAFVGGAARAVRSRDPSLSSGRMIGSALGGLARIAYRLLPPQQIQQLRHNLVIAGNPNGWRVEEFLTVRMLLAIAFGAIGYLLGVSRGVGTTILAVAVLGALGYLLPAIWLGSKIRARKVAIFRAMPNALDMISVTVEAGLGFDQAVSEVCQKWQNELTKEFATFLAELQVGRDRREAMRGIVERTDVPELNGFVSAVIQADELGTGIARTLTAQAEQMRIKRRQLAERLAHEAAIKMLFPLVFLIFPAIFVVILGPAIPIILNALGNL